MPRTSASSSRSTPISPSQTAVPAAVRAVMESSATSQARTRSRAVSPRRTDLPPPPLYSIYQPLALEELRLGMSVRVRDALLQPWEIGEVHALSPLLILVRSSSGATRKSYRFIEQVPEDASIYEIKEKCEMDLREERDEAEGRFGTAGRSRTPSERFGGDRTPSPSTVFHIGSSAEGSATPPMAQPDPQHNLPSTPPPQEASDVISNEANEMAKALLDVGASVGDLYHSPG